MPTSLITWEEDIEIHQGTTFNPEFLWESGATSATLTPVDLTGVTGEMRIAASYDAAAALLTVTTAGGGVVIGNAAGTVQPIIADDVTANLPDGVLVYELDLSWPDGSTQRFLRGTAKVYPKVPA